MILVRFDQIERGGIFFHRGDRKTDGWPVHSDGQSAIVRCGLLITLP